MTMQMGEQPPIDILAVEFGDRAVTISYHDNRFVTEFGEELRQLILRPEKFEEAIVELRDNIYDLILSYQEQAGATPMTRPGRVQP